jgi:hypothetical protein
MDGPREQEVKWSKPGSERQSLHAFSYLWKIDPNINKNIIVHIYIYMSYVLYRIHIHINIIYDIYKIMSVYMHMRKGDEQYRVGGKVWC